MLPITQNKKDKILGLLNGNIPYKEISNKLACSMSTISSIANENGMGKKQNRYDWEAIQKYHSSGNTVRECVKRFGFAHASWHKAVKRGVLKPRNRRTPIEHLLVCGKSNDRRHIKRRILSEGILSYECEICGISKWLQAPLSLELDHKNGNKTDWRKENLRLLCPNCHSQTETFSSRNPYRKLKPKAVV